MQLPVAIKEFFPSGSFRTGLDLQPGRKLSLHKFTEQRTRFLDEARVLARLNHPGIVRVHTGFEENHTAYMVMEYLRGRTLASRLNEHGRLEEDELLVYVFKLAKALTALHGHGQEGFLHRDIKPSNIVITAEGRVVLIDFGAARQFAANVSRSMSQVLTPGYAPLEQYSARARFGPPVDIYAVGATMYHALTGQPPPDAVDRSQGVELVPPHVACATVSRQTSEAIMAALEMVAAQRPQCMSDLVKLLKGGSRSATPMPPPPPPQPPPPPPPSRPACPVMPRESRTARTTPSWSSPAPAAPAGLRLARVNPQGCQEYTNEKDRTVLIRIPGGTFTMGSNDADDERPPHTVTLAPFLMARVPVTNAQFARFVADTHHDAGNSWKKYASKWGDQAPVVCVTWDDATAYCRWAGLRLPSEAEWEFTARGPQGLTFPWGNEWAPYKCQNSVGNNCPGRAVPVGQYPAGASPFGCLDMAGNVWEWTSSWYDRYPGSTYKDDAFGQKYRVLRGGSWNYSVPPNFRGSCRNGYHPVNRFNNNGFRCARSLP